MYRTHLKLSRAAPIEGRLRVACRISRSCSAFNADGRHEDGRNACRSEEAAEAHLRKQRDSDQGKTFVNSASPRNQAGFDAVRMGGDRILLSSNESDGRQ